MASDGRLQIGWPSRLAPRAATTKIVGVQTARTNIISAKTRAAGLRRA
jgi:hypothetical protein